MGGRKALFSPFEVSETSETPLGRSVSTELVADCSIFIFCFQGPTSY